MGGTTDRVPVLTVCYDWGPIAGGRLITAGRRLGQATERLCDESNLVKWETDVALYHIGN